VEQQIKMAFESRKKVLHSVFSKPSFNEDLELFLSDVDNASLPSSCIWNVALLYNQLTQKIHRPGVNCLLDYFNDDLSTLHKNIDIFITDYIGDTDDKLMFEYRMGFHATFNHKELLELGKKTHSVSLQGRCDMVNRTKAHLYEIKASGLDHCSNQWISQTLMYSLCLDVYGYKMKKMSIVNLLKGCIWTWHQLPETQTLESVVSTQIGEFYEWHKLEVDKILKDIETRRRC
jgi:hypothetical protein